MKEDFYLIDEIAQKLGVTKRTIRYYEEQGLLKPTTRTEKGYRLYSEEDISRLKRILELRDTTGFSLKDIKEILLSEDTILEMRQAFYEEENPDEKRMMLKEIKTNLLDFLDLIGRKKALLESIEIAYTERLKRVNKYLKELE